MEQSSTSRARDIIIVKKEHIAPGIEKYQGKVDADLEVLFLNSGLEVKPYLFQDGRVLLIYKNQDHGILYSSLETLLKKIDLEK